MWRSVEAWMRKGIAISMMNALQRSSFREAVRAKAVWDGVDMDPDKPLQKMDNFMVKWEENEQMKAAGAVARGDGRRES